MTTFDAIHQPQSAGAGQPWSGFEPPGLRPRLLRPRLSPGHVARPRLLQEISRQRPAPVTLLVAPSGSGKTTLLGEWLATRAHPVVWLGLDEDLDDAVRLAQALIHAIRGVAPGFGRAISAVLETTGDLSPEDLGAALARDLQEVGQPLALVLDDMHACASPGALHVVASLVEQGPRGMHVAIATRTMPALPVEEWQSAGRLVMIRAGDLRFLPDEAAALAVALGADDSDAASVEAVVAASGGWVALLRMMLSRNGSMAAMDPADAGAARSGILTGVAGALVDTMLAGLAPADADLLTWAALTDTTCSDLAAAIVAAAAVECASVHRLEDFASDGVWLTPVGDDSPSRSWFRFHPLVRDRLLDRLVFGASRGAIAAAYRRAAAWYRAQGRIDEAVTTGLLGDDVAGVVALVAEAGFAAIEGERWESAARLLDLLPTEIVDAHAPLLALRAWNAYRLGRPLAFSVDTRRIRDLLTPVDGEDGPHLDRERWLAHAAVIDRFSDDETAGFSDALAAYARVAPGIPLCDGMVRGIHAAGTALAAVNDGSFEDALAFLDARLAAHPSTIESAIELAAVALLHGFRGCNPRAEMAALERLYDLAAATELPVSLAFASSRLGWLALKRMDLDEAAARFAESASAPATPLVNAWREERFGLALVRHLSGDAAGALDLAESVVRTVGHVDDLPLAENSRAGQALLWLLQRRYGEADVWLNSVAFDPGVEAPYWRVWMPEVWVHAQLTRVPLVAQPGRLRQEIAAMIARAEETAARLHDATAHAAMRIARALLDDAFGDRGSAVEAIARVVDDIAEWDNVLVFALHGERILPLLHRARRGATNTVFLDRIIEAAEHVASLHSHRPASRELSRREQEVLRLLTSGYDRHDVAARLFISEPTVRRHAITIYSKLGVSSHGEAVRVAQAYGLIADRFR